MAALESGTLDKMNDQSDWPRTSGIPPRIASVRIAATGDLHLRGQEDQREILGLSDLRGQADLLLVAGDLTENGRLVEAEAAGELLATARVPVVDRKSVV